MSERKGGTYAWQSRTGRFPCTALVTLVMCPNGSAESVRDGFDEPAYLQTRLEAPVQVGPIP